MVGEILEDGERGHGEDALLLHQAHGLVAQLRGVIEGGNAGLRGIERARLALIVDADVGADPLGLFHRRGQLRLGVLVRRVEFAVDHAIRPGFVDFEEIRALLVLFAHGFNDLFGIVGAVGIGEHVLFGVESVGVFVPAQDVDSVGADAHARPGNDAFIDGVAHRGAGRSRAFRAHVALGGKAAHQVGFRGLLGKDGAPRHRLLHRLQVFRAGMQEEVHMGVDHARHQRYIAQIDDLCVLWMVDRLPRGFDAVALDQHLARLDHRAGAHVEETSGVKNNRRGRRRLLRHQFGCGAQHGACHQSRPAEQSRKSH